MTSEGAALGAQPPRRFGYVSQQIQRALDVLEALSASDQGLTLSELSEALDLPKSSTVRLLANLEMRSFIEQDDMRRYRIGLHLFSIGGRALAGSQLRVLARPSLEQIAQYIGESTYLAIPDQGQALYIDRIESPMPVTAQSPIGSHRPLHATAVGKVLLASMEADEVDDILSRGMAAVTSKTLTDPDLLRKQLVSIARDGYAIDYGEFDEGLTCLAAPIRDFRGLAVAAIGLSGPAWRLNGDRLSLATQLLIEHSAGISARVKGGE